MKRYDLDFCDSSEGAWVLWEDVRAILDDCLKIVPVGKKCEAGELCPGDLFTCDSDGVFAFADWSGVNIRDIVERVDSALTTSTIVQPVRLVPAMDYLEEKQ